MAGENLVKFIFGTKAQFDALATKDSGTIYFITDTRQIYKGNVLYDGGAASVAADLATLEGYIGTLPVDAQYEDLIDYIEKNDIATANLVTTLENSLADVATSGAAADVAIQDTAGNFAATNVEDALGELYTAIGTGGTSAAVSITKTAGGASDNYVYRYTFSQGGSQIANGVIDIAKDMVATDGELVHPTVENPIVIDGNQVTSGVYIAMTIANGDVFYINVADLIEYNTVDNTSEIILTDTNHTITATVGEIAASKIIYREADTSDPENPVAQQTVAQAINALESAVGSGGSIDTRIQTALNALDADLDASITPADTEAIAVMAGVTETDGVLTSIDSVAADKAGAATRAKNAVIGNSGDTATASTIYGAKAYADSLVTNALTWTSLS